MARKQSIRTHPLWEEDQRLEADARADLDAFCLARLKNFKNLGADAEWQQMYIDALRSDILLPKWYRRYIANELRRYYFDTPAQARAEGRYFKAWRYQRLIERTAKEGGVSKAKAKAKIVAELGLKSVEALDQFLRRVKQERKKR